MNKSMNIGIIGTGVGLRLHYSRFRDVQGAKILAISGSNEQRTIEFAKQFNIPKACADYKELCEMPELDLIVVASPNLFHYDHVLYAQKCNKHILAEKPLAMDLTEIKTLAKNAENSSKICIINHQLRFNPYIKKVKELISDNAIGDPYFIRIHQQSTSFSNRNTPWSWIFDDIQGGGVRLAMGSHLLDTLQYWLNKKCCYVSGAINPVVKTRFDKNGKKWNVTASGFFSANLSLEQNIDVQLSATAASCGISRFDFSIYGTKGELHFD
ncbi:MAG: Gfo/Idh/MocA family oxidoreductase, partial [Desulfobacula sp.]|nr:Gfo/Idh/MocA family oxidoreductase [Desulfobacula sp.]